MTKDETATIENIIARLRSPAIGSGGSFCAEVDGKITTSRNYVNTWLIGALECLLPGDGRDPKLARSLSSK